MERNQSISMMYFNVADAVFAFQCSSTKSAPGVPQPVPDREKIGRDECGLNVNFAKIVPLVLPPPIPTPSARRPSRLRN